MLSSLGSTRTLDAGSRCVCLVQQRCAPKQELKVLFQFNKSRVWGREPKGLTWILAGGKQPEGKGQEGSGRGRRISKREGKMCEIIHPYLVFMKI